jgi:hypothetical protein
MNEIISYKRPSLAEVAASNVDAETINQTADRIANAWYKSVESILQTVRELEEAYALYENDQSSLSLFQEALWQRGMGKSTLDKLHGIGKNLSMFKEDKIRFLPPSYNALYEMTNKNMLPHFDKIMRGLEKGGEYTEVKKEVLINLSKGGKGRKKTYETILSLDVKWNKLDDTTIIKIRNFISAMSKDETATKVKVSRSWKQFMDED